MALERGLDGLRCGALLALGFLALGALAGCTAAVTPPQPFQAMKTTTDMAYGYTDNKIDPLHYSVVYSGNREDLAQAYLEQRAAQISRDAGFAWFAFDKRGVQVLRRSDSDLVIKDRIRTLRDQGASNVNDYIPEAHLMSVATYYYAWGQIALLSPAQAQGNTNALQVSTVLAHPGSGARTP